MSGQSIAPIFLRLALGATFLWAGFGKLLETMPVKGERAAILANLGAIPLPATATSPGTPVLPPPPPQVIPVEPTENGDPSTDQPTEPDEAVVTEPGSGTSKPVVVKPNPATDQSVANPAPTVRVATAADFPDEIRVRRVFGLALLIHGATNPGTTESGTTKVALWPAKLGTGHWPVVFAWAAAITEIVAGLFVLVGLLTRMSALSLAFCMVVAIWLTEVGPALQSGDTFLGFLPNYKAFGSDAAGNPLFARLFWQFSLLCIGLALTFSGPGWLSFDRALFPPRLARERGEPNPD